jgi:hypothetical protein
VVLHGPDPAAERDAHRDRHSEGARGAVVHLRDLAHDLVEPGVDEAVELDLAHRAVTADSQAHRRADDARLGERGVPHPLLTEVLLEPVGDPEHPAQPSHVLAHDHDFGVVLQSLAQTLVEGLGQGDRHRHEPASIEAR